MTQADRQSTSRRRWVPGIRCVICGEKIFLYQRFNFDHVVPMSRGGPRGRSNKKLAHVICNSVKGSRHPYSLRTQQERERLKRWVSETTWLALCAVWSGRPG